MYFCKEEAGCPDEPTYVEGYYHLGQDVEASEGDNVYAISDGVVSNISYSSWEEGNLGIVLSHITRPIIERDNLHFR